MGTFLHLLDILLISFDFFIYQRGGDGGGEAVVDVDGGDTCGTAIEHRQEGGQSLEGRAVADTGWHRDDRATHQAAHDAGQRAFHSRDDNDYVGLLQLRQMFK